MEDELGICRASCRRLGRRGRALPRTRLFLSFALAKCVVTHGTSSSLVQKLREAAGDWLVAVPAPAPVAILQREPKSERLWWVTVVSAAAGESRASGLGGKGRRLSRPGWIAAPSAGGKSESGG